MLVRLAERANPRRSFLLVSTVLGKHLPVPAARCRLAGVALGLRIAGDARAQRAEEALFGDRAAALVDEIERLPARTEQQFVVVGTAETATALGEQVASALDATWFATTTRQVAGMQHGVRFDEVHSHAPAQWIVAPQSGWPDGVVAIVDDELTTGATAARLIEVVQAQAPRERYVVAALVDGRDGGDGPLAQCAAALGVRIDVVALQRRGAPEHTLPGWSGGMLPARSVNGYQASEVRDVRVGFGGPLQHEGQDRAARRSLAQAAAVAAAEVGPLADGTLVLGTGEHLAFAQRCAAVAGRALTSSTTRSPILVSEREQYPIRDGLAFANPDDLDVPGFAYNVCASQRPSIVVHFQDRAHRARGQELLDVLQGAGARELVAVTLAD
ncbi:MAG TPA: phosphoribosyltransferase domain-containing protein [Solirubrobacteraceae bacterium]